MPTPYGFGSTTLPGLAKVIEEIGEVSQVAGKIMAVGNLGDHWDGSNLQERLESELGDLLAAIAFFIDKNNLNKLHIAEQLHKKIDIFEEWHRDEPPVSPRPSSEHFSFNNYEYDYDHEVLDPKTTKVFPGDIVVHEENGVSTTLLIEHVPTISDNHYFYGGGNITVSASNIKDVCSADRKISPWQIRNFIEIWRRKSVHESIKAANY